MNSRFEEILFKINPEIQEKPDANLINEGLLDSLQTMNLIAELEEAFSMEFDYDDVTPENFNSVDAIWGLVIKRGGRLD